MNTLSTIKPACGDLSQHDEPKHTPTPWFRLYCQDSYQIGGGGDDCGGDHLIAVVNHANGENPNASEDSELIVKAVNEHAALLAVELAACTLLDRLGTCAQTLAERDMKSALAALESIRNSK